MRLEVINCPICNSDKNEILFFTKDFRFKLTDDHFEIVRCSHCEFIFLNPRPIQNEINNFYPIRFYKSGYFLYYKAFGLFFKFIQKPIIGSLKKYKRSGKLLDIGCGTGHFISQMRLGGYEVYGIETSENAKNFIPDSLKNRIYDRNLEECGFQENSFDIITIFQSLEHAHNLNRLLKEAKKILKPDGILYLSVPNYDFFEYRIFGPYAYTLDVPRHLYFFTKRSLRNLLLENGFVIDRFIRNFIGELFITPASIYHAVWSYFADKHKLRNRMLKLLSFVPLVMMGFLLHILFISEGHILEVGCKKSLKKNE
jgi:SAM-dependent methyltransferase